MTEDFAVTGMTCGHCVVAVVDEISTIDGVSGVSIELVKDGASRVTVTSNAPVRRDDIVSALDEAGDYHLV